MENINQTYNAAVRDLVNDSLGQKEYSKKAQAIISEIESGEISEKTIKLLLKAKNGTNKTFADFELKKITQLIWDEQPTVTESQFEKGKSWLEKLANKRYSPLGYREKEVIENLSSFSFDGFYDAAKYGQKAFYLPLYSANAEGVGSFQYYMQNGEINIIG